MNKDYSNEIDLRRFIRELYTRKWLFSGIFLLILGLTIAYIARSESIYTAHSAILIEDSSDTQGARAGGSMMQMMRLFSTGGFTSSSVDNELLLVNTIDVAMRTVQALNLNVNCVEKKGILNKTLFEDAPLSLTLNDECADTLAKPFNVKVTVKNGKGDIKVTTGRFFKKNIYEKKNVTFPCQVSTELADFTISAGYSQLRNGTFVFGVTGYSAAAWDLYKTVKIKIIDKLADGIEFTYSTQNRNKALAILNTLMNEYNLKRLERKRETSLTEYNFINGRINALHNDLRESESKVEKFKTESNFVDIESETPVILETALTAREELNRVSYQIIYYEQVLSILNSHEDGMLPTLGTLSVDGSFSNADMVGKYNEQMSVLMELRRSAKPGNRALVAAESRIDQMRNSLIASFNQLLKAAKTSMTQRSSVVGSMDSKLNKLPSIEKEYINLSRDQLVKNELYAFLVEKRENALMKLNSEDTLGFVIDKAYLEPKTNKTKPIILFIAGLFSALVLPLLIALIFLKRNDYVNNTFDLASFGCEDRAIDLSDSCDATGELRSAIMTALEKGTVYIDNLDDTGLPTARIVKSFSSAGIPNAEVKPDNAEIVLGTAFREDLFDALKDNSYAFVELPQSSIVRNLAPVINADNSLCLIILRKGLLTRKEVTKMIDGLKHENILIALT